MKKAIVLYSVKKASYFEEFDEFLQYLLYEIDIEYDNISLIKHDFSAESAHELRRQITSEAFVFFLLDKYSNIYFYFNLGLSIGLSNSSKLPVVFYSLDNFHHSLCSQSGFYLTKDNFENILFRKILKAYLFKEWEIFWSMFADYYIKEIHFIMGVALEKLQSLEECRELVPKSYDADSLIAEVIKNCTSNYQLHGKMIFNYLKLNKKPMHQHPIYIEMTIKIFLASSEELKEDRDQFEIFINRENKHLVKRGVFLELIRWEDFLDTISLTRLQDEYNKEIRSCQIVVCLFHTKVGKYTAEEFDEALGHFRHTGEPKIFTYFKDAPVKPSEMRSFNTVLDFKQKLSDIGHFPNHYESLGDLKHHFGEQLKKLKIGE